MGTGPAETARPVLLFLPYFYIPLAPALKPVFAHIVVKIRKRPALSIFARIVAKSRRGTGGRVKCLHLRRIQLSVEFQAAQKRVEV